MLTDITDANINLFHRINTEREIIPNKYQLLSNNNNLKNNSKPCFKSLGNLTKNQEDQIIYSNNNKSIESPIKIKNDFCCNNIINIDKNKIITYFLCNNYEDLLHLFELYIINIFNGNDIEKIPILFEKNLISDLIYVNAIYCINIIKLSQKSNKTRLVSGENKLETTEVFFKVKESDDDNLRFEALLLILGFIELLRSIDETSYTKEIKKLKEIIEKVKQL